MEHLYNLQVQMLQSKQPRVERTDVHEKQNEVSLKFNPHVLVLYRERDERQTES